MNSGRFVYLNNLWLNIFIGESMIKNRSSCGLFCRILIKLCNIFVTPTFQNYTFKIVYPILVGGFFIQLRNCYVLEDETL